MADITPFLAQRDGLRDALRDYCRDHFELSWNSSTLSFIDFISEKLGLCTTTRALRRRFARIWPSERIQEEMDLKKIL